MINPPKPRKTEANTDIKRFYDKSKNSSKMTKVLRFLKKPVALLIGAISGGGSIFAGLGVEHFTSMLVLSRSKPQSIQAVKIVLI